MMIFQGFSISETPYSSEVKQKKQENAPAFKMSCCNLTFFTLRRNRFYSKLLLLFRIPVSGTFQGEKR